jgi:hypothetical protein
MTKEQEDLIRAMRELLGSKSSIVPAVVKSRDAATLTCVVELLDETEIPEVRLKAAIEDTTITDGLVQIPKAESTVLIGMIGNDSNTWAVLMYSEVDEVLFFDGSNGGIPKVEPLVSKLNAIENKVNSLISYINGHSHASHGTPPAPLFSGGNLTTTEREDLENEKVKH